MPKNPYFVCFNSPASEDEIQFLRDISYDFDEIFPHAFWLAANYSPSQFEHIISERFAGKDHFYALIQKNQRITYHLSDQEKSPREL
jgi:hypothetical protein